MPYLKKHQAHRCRQTYFLASDELVQWRCATIFYSLCRFPGRLISIWRL